MDLNYTPESYTWKSRDNTFRFHREQVFDLYSQGRWQNISNDVSDHEIRARQSTLSRATDYPRAVSWARSSNPGLRHVGNTLLGHHDLGANFYTVKAYTEYSHPSYSADVVNGIRRVRYSGPIELTRLTSSSAVAWPLVPPTDWASASLFAMGGQAIRAVTPERPDSSLLVMIGELKHGAPRLMPELLRDRTRFFKSLGSDYLNVEFGWKPFINDLRSQVTAVRNHDRILIQFARNSGRPMKRSYTFPRVFTSETTYSDRSAFQSPSNTWFHASGSAVGQRRTVREDQIDVNFKGQFRYYIPDRDLSILHRRESMLNRILGTRLTPDVLWELTPWSWLIDWVVDVGGFLENISNLGQDNLVLQYGYLMRQHRREVTHYQKLVPAQGPAVDAWQKFGSVAKLRTHASPYGFGVNFDGLSPRQLAILAALGASRGSKDSW